jgi:hypothetical protein
MLPPLVRSSKNAGQTINKNKTSCVYCLSDRAEPSGIANAINAQICQPCVILLLHLKGKKFVYRTIFQILVELKFRRTPVLMYLGHLILFW